MADLRVGDNAGNMISYKTVQDWIDFYKAQGYSGNFFINKKCYDFFTLSVRTPYDVDKSKVVTKIDNGYYGTPGIITE